MKNLVIIGADDLGKELVWLIEDINKTQPRYLILGFLDDDAEKQTRSFFGYKVLGGTDLLEQLASKTPLSAVVAITEPNKRRRLVERHPGFDRWETIRHPLAVIADAARYGKGSIFFPNAVVSVDSVLGDFGLCHIHTTVGSDCVLGDYVSVMTNACVSGHSQIGDCCFLEAGSCVYPCKHIGKNVHLAVGAIAGRDYPDGSMVKEGGTGLFLFP